MEKMKNFVARLSVVLLVCVGCVVLFSECKKDTTCHAAIKAYYSENGVDILEPAANAYIQIGTNTNYADFARAEGYANEEGVFTWDFKYEASLDVVAENTREYWVNENESVQATYRGSSQIKLVPGETVEVTVLLLPE